MSDASALRGIYLNDHLAGATAGLDLFRRAARAASPGARPDLTRLATEVEQDRASLLGVMRRLDVPVRRYKVTGGWLLEKAGRIKLNRRLWRRSPLSDLVELEALVLGVHGKAAGFRALRSIAATEPRLDAAELDRLVERAERQGEVLERLRLEAAGRALAGA